MRSHSDVPVIITTGHRTDEIDRIVGLELGADDYIVKPFSLRELLARVRAVLRRQEMGRAARASDPERGGYRFNGWVLQRRGRKLADPDGGRGPPEQGRICPVAGFSRGASTAPDAGTSVAGHAHPRGHFRSEHRCPGPAIAAQARGRSERAARHPDRARRRLCFRSRGRTILSRGDARRRAPNPPAQLWQRQVTVVTTLSIAEISSQQTASGSLPRVTRGSTLCWRSIHSDKRTEPRGSTGFPATMRALLKDLGTGALARARARNRTGHCRADKAR